MKTNKLKKVLLILFIQMVAMFYSQAGTVSINNFSLFNNNTFGNCIGDTIKFFFEGHITGYTIGTSNVSVLINFGDGTNVTIPISTIDSGSLFTYRGITSHIYTTSGNMNPNIIVTALSDGAIRTITSPTLTILAGCNSLTGSTFTDCNNNCVFDIGEENTGEFSLTNTSGLTRNVYTSFGAYSINIPSGLYTMSFPQSLCNPYGTNTISTSTNYNISSNCNPTGTSSNIYGSSGSICSGHSTWFRYDFVTFPSSGYIAGDNVIVTINYGDGTINNFTVPLIDTGVGMTVIYGDLYHTYITSGNYVPTISFLMPDGKISIAHNEPIEIISSCDEVSGFLYNDANGNCIKDAGESPLVNYPVSINGGGLVDHDFTDINGFYSLHVPTGVAYNLYISSYSTCPTGVIPFCPSSGSVSFTLSGSYNQDFAFSGSTSFDASVYFYNISPRSYIRTDENSSGRIGYNVASTTPISGTVSMTLDPLTVFVSSVPTPTSISGSVITWNYSGLTTTSGMQYIDVTFHTSPLADSFNPMDSTGDIICLDFDITPTIVDCYLPNNHEHLCIPVGMSWDPNHKEVSPQGIGAEGFIAPGTDLTYTVHFQNMGTSFARNVFVMDTLDPDLDISTFQLISNSHPVQVHWLEGNILKFAFDNIMLVDTGVSQDSSQGYFQYRIKHNATAPIGTEISNTASIYFDFNPAIVTNTTHNKLGNPNSIPNRNNESSTIKIYPNPAQEYVMIETEGKELATVEVYNMLGKLIETKAITNHQEKLSIEKYINGVYLINVLNKTGQIVDTKKLNVIK